MELEQAVAFASGRSKGVLLTIQRNGMPHASNILYATFDDRFHVSVTDSRVKTGNVRHDPRAGLYVSSEDFGSWVVVEGDVHVSGITNDPDDEPAARLRRVYETIAGPHPDWDEFNRVMIDERRLVLSIQPTRAYGQMR